MSPPGEEVKVGVRLRYTGLVAYAASVLTAVIGLLFSALVTRRLTPEELGVWRYIGVLIGYFLIPAHVLGFWSTRLTAQGQCVLRTLLALYAPIMAAATLMFLVAAGRPLSFAKHYEAALLVAALEIPAIYSYSAFESVAAARAPHLNYYVTIIQDVVKLPLGFILVVGLRLSLIGALLAAILSFAVRALSIAILLRKVDWGAVDLRLARRLLSLAWLPLYGLIPSQIGSLDNIIVVLLLQAIDPLGYLAALGLIGGVIAMSGSLAAALYPRMLQRPSGRDVEVALSLTMMLAIPTSVGAIVLSEQLLNILRPEYVAVASLTPLIALGSILSIVNSVAEGALIGGERADYGVEVSWSAVVRSKLFLVPTLNLASSAIYIAALSTALIILRPRDCLSVILAWTSIGLLVSLGFVAYKWRLASRRLGFSAPKLQLVKYLASSTVMAIVVYLARPASLPMEVLHAIASTMPTVLLGSLTYFGALSIIDRDFRSLLRGVGAQLKAWAHFAR
ncbi:MAG: hypothetical protein N3H31_04335 [Candidatus Nezhaarchaeota archaeon]|nr:hypothetical protein [Candidatus Nezhaarchaeota archaeon]